jgi:peptidoglycan/LPS O-acetylase OafA/YrhL
LPGSGDRHRLVGGELSAALFQVAVTSTIPLSMVIAAGARADLAGHRTWLSRPLVRWLGKISFAFSMVHALIVSYGHLLLGGGSWSTPMAFAVVLLLFETTVVAAYLLHRFVEEPLMSRFGVPRRSRGPVTVPPVPEPVVGVRRT